MKLLIENGLYSLSMERSPFCLWLDLTFNPFQANNILTNETTGLPILQFVSIKREDTGEFAIPGGMCDPGENVSQSLKREFGEEALNTDAFPER